MQRQVAEDLCTIFNAPHQAPAERYLAETLLKYEKTASQLARWMEENIAEGLTVFPFSSAHRRRFRTSNGIERFNQEIKRHTKVVWIFPSQASCFWLVSALLMEISDE